MEAERETGARNRGGALSRWRALWQELPQEERVRAAEALLGDLRTPSAGEEGAYRERYLRALLKALARRMHIRPQTLHRFPADKTASILARWAGGFLEPFDWKHLFRCYYLAHRRRLITRFLDLAGVPHREGLVEEEFEPPGDIAKAVEVLVAEHGKDEVRRYFSVLLLSSPETWAFVEPALRDLEEAREEGGTATSGTEEHAPPETSEEAAASVGVTSSEEFTQVDRVAIDQILATVAGGDRALSPEELVDFVEGLLALDSSRGRTYFHLGMLDRLLAGREPDLGRAEMNDARRGWYLAGVLAACARQRDGEALAHWIDARRSDFDRTAAHRGGAGEAMAKTLVPVLIEQGRVADAVVLLRGQADALGAGAAFGVLERASGLLRDGELARAKALLAVLDEIGGRFRFPDEDMRRAFCVRVRRKLGQAHQAEGRLEQARALLERLCEEGADDPELLADLGYVEAGFRAVAQVRIEADGERRRAVREALARGRTWFERAVGVGGDRAVNGHYALAVLRYLEWRDGDGGEEAREAALAHALAAESGMIGSPHADAYERMGIAGQCRFVIAACRLGRLEPGEVPPALEAWAAIQRNAGRFPLDHLRAMLEDARLVDESAAVELAESVWDVRGIEALEALGPEDWMLASDRVRGILLEVARNEDQPCRRRFGVWCRLVTAAVRTGRREIAEEGLDALEALAETEGELAERLLTWLEENAGQLDPVWSEADRLRAQAVLLDRLDRKADADEALRALFFAVRARWPQEARRVRELLRARKASGALLEGLVLAGEEEGEGAGDADGVDARLAAGERARVLFVGGNEIQARYDVWIRGELRARWPGVEVRFEHTAWTSNWGREYARLRRLAAESDAVVLMVMMRTMLGRKLRDALNDPPRPWIACTGTGRKALLRSIEEAARVAVRCRDRNSPDAGEGIRDA